VAEDDVQEAYGRKDTDKGAILWEGDEDLKAGDAVFVEGEDGNEQAPDGDYKTEDGKVIVVENGIVVEIKDAEAEVARKTLHAGASRSARNPMTRNTAPLLQQ
jgi:hypothetical protein